MKISPALCAGYMEYLIDEAGDANPVFHDRLAELYLKAAQDTRTSESGLAGIDTQPFSNVD